MYCFLRETNKIFFEKQMEKSQEISSNFAIRLGMIWFGLWRTKFTKSFGVYVLAKFGFTYGFHTEIMRSSQIFIQLKNITRNVNKNSRVKI